MRGRPIVRSVRQNNAPGKSSVQSDYRAIIVPTQKPLSTIKETGAHSFVVNRCNVMLVCHRTYDAGKILEVFGHRAEPGFSHEKKVLGGRVYCNENQCSLFSIDDNPLEIGERYFHVLLKAYGRTMMASISLQVRPIENPSKATFTKNVHMRAALEVFNTRVRQAEHELAQEIDRIMRNHYE